MKNLFLNNNVQKVLTDFVGRFGRIIVLDMETTGLDAEKDNIIEFAANKIFLKEESLVNTAETYLLKCDGILSESIVALTGITDNLLSKAGIDRSKGERKIIESLYSEPALIMSFNTQFDLNFIYKILERHNCCNIFDRANYLDIMTIYRDRAEGKHSLSAAAEHYGIGVEGVHRAGTDADTALQVFCSEIFEQNDILHYLNLFGVPKKYGRFGREFRKIQYLMQEDAPKKKLYEL